MKTWIGRSARLGSRTRRPTSTLPFSATKGLPQTQERVLQRARPEGLLADRSSVGDHGAVAHYVEAALRGAQQAGARDLDPGVDALVGGVIAKGADLRQPALPPHLVHPLPRLGQGILERLEPLALDARTVPDGHLPAHARQASRARTQAPRRG